MGPGFLLLFGYVQITIWHLIRWNCPWAGCSGAARQPFSHWSLWDKTPTHFSKHCGKTLTFLICGRTWGTRFSSFLSLYLPLEASPSPSDYLDTRKSSHYRWRRGWRGLMLSRHCKPLFHLSTLDSWFGSQINCCPSLMLLWGSSVVVKFLPDWDQWWPSLMIQWQENKKNITDHIV